MPSAAPRPCRICNVLVRDGSSRCDKHKVAEGSFADRRRGSRHERGYGSAWERIRARILKRDAGLCQVCLQQGIVTPGCRTVDHIINKAQGGTDDDANLQTICTPCHTTKTAAEARAARRGGGIESPTPFQPGPTG